MTYTIEQGIPIPAARGGNTARRPVPRPPTSPLSLAMLAMEVGDSVLLQTAPEYQRVLGRLTRFAPRVFVVRKLPREGWRVWRTA